MQQPAIGHDGAERAVGLREIRTQWTGSNKLRIRAATKVALSCLRRRRNCLDPGGHRANRARGK